MGILDKIVYKVSVNRYVNGIESKSSLLLAKIIEKKEYDLITFFDDKAFSKRILTKYHDQLIDFFKNSRESYYAGKRVFSFLMNNGEVLTAVKTISHDEVDDVVRKYGKQVADYFTNNMNADIFKQYNEDMGAFANNKTFYDFCIKNGCFSIAASENFSDYNKNLPNGKYFNEVVNAIKKMNAVPSIYSDNEKLFKYFLDNKELEYVMQFSLIDDKIIEQYIEEFAKLADSSDRIYYLKNYKLLFDYLVKNKMYGATQKFSNFQVSSNIEKDAVIGIANEIIKSNYVPNIYFKSKDLFEYFIKNKMFSYAIYFDVNLIENCECKNEILDYIGTIATISSDFPYNNKIDLLRFCFKNNRDDYYFKLFPYVFGFRLFDYDNVKSEWNQKLVNIYLNNLDELDDIDLEQLKVLVELKAWELVFYADESIFFQVVKEEHYSEIADFLSKNDQPLYQFYNNKKFFNYCLNNGCYSLLLRFNPNLFDNFKGKEKYLISTILKEKNVDYIYNFHYNLKLYNALYDYALETKNYDFIFKYCSDKFLKDIFSTGNNHNNKFDDLKNEYLKIIGLTIEELKARLDLCIGKNEEFLLKINGLFLDKKYQKISNKNFLEIALYPELQTLIINFNDTELNVFFKVIDVLESKNVDLKNYLMLFCNNISFYKNVINTIDINTISDEQLKNLMFIIKDKNNTYNINNINELTNEGFKRKKEELYSEYSKKISNGTVSIEELRNVVLLKLIGLNISEAKFICTRYCHFLSNNMELNHRIKEILLMINKIVTTNNIDELKVLFNGRDINYQCLDFEAVLRREYAKLFNKTLYQLNDKDLIESKNVNPKVLERIQKMEYKGYRPKIYLPTDDFRMQITVLGAYSDYTKPDNFMDEWLCPKIASHGICTSYIANNQIANARAYHPMLGFASFEDSSLLLAASYDIGSSHANISYNISKQMPTSFKTPNETIDCTRHTHNEMVIDRLIQNNGEVVKRTPDYIVYPVDDINNPYCFMTKEELVNEFRNAGKSDLANSIKNSRDLRNIDFYNLNDTDAYKVKCVFLYEETLQAAHDMNVPIVILDRLYHAKREKQECLAMVNDFKNKLDVSLLPKILCEYLNNYIGCIDYLNLNLEYNKMFNLEDLDLVYSDIINYISTIDNNYVKKYVLDNVGNSINEEKKKILSFKRSGVDKTYYRIISKLDEILKKVLDNYKMIEATDSSININEDSEHIRK